MIKIICNLLKPIKHVGCYLPFGNDNKFDRIQPCILFFMGFSKSSVALIVKLALDTLLVILTTYDL